MGARAGVKGKELYLLDVLRHRLEYSELKHAVREQYERFRPSVVPIEDKASGTQLIQELTREGLHAVTRYQPRSDKIMRMHAQTAMIENGFVRVPDKAPWLAQYLDEMTVFPNGRQTRRHPASRFPLAHRRLLQQHRYQPRAVRMKLCVARVPLDVDHLPRRPVTPRSNEPLRLTSG